jgi:hypothetical protein
MWNPRREIPQIADTYVVDKVSPLRIDGRDARGSIERGFSRPIPAAKLASEQEKRKFGNASWSVKGGTSISSANPARG